MIGLHLGMHRKILHEEEALQIISDRNYLTLGLGVCIIYIYIFFFLVKKSNFGSAQAKYLCKLKQIALAPLDTCTRLDHTHHITNHLLEIK